MKDMEKNEQDMLLKLQNTIMLERKEIVKLEDTKKVKIDGSRARIDGYLGVSDRRKIEAIERAEKTLKELDWNENGQIKAQEFLAHSYVAEIKASDSALFEELEHQLKAHDL